MKEKRLAVQGNGVPLEIELPDSGGIEKNEYYLAVSRRFRLARLLVLFVLLFYIMLMVTVFGEDITVANFSYLFRDINLSASTGEAFSGVTYSAEPIQRFDLYRGDLVYVTGSEVRLFSATGNTGLHTGISYEVPTVISGEKYVMIYDLGGHGFTVYNSFSELFRESTDYEIIDADMADSGDFAVVTRGREYRSIVQLYDDDFNLITKYSKRDYVVCVALSRDGESIAMAEISAVPSDFVTKLSFYKKGADAASATVTMAGEYPLRISRTEEGFAVLGRNGVYFFSFDGEKTGEYKVSEALGMAAFSGKYTVISLPQNVLESRNRIVILDSQGNSLYNKVIDEKLTDISVSDMGKAYLLTGKRAVMIDISANAEKVRAVTASSEKIIAAGGESVILCTSSSASTIDFSVLEEKNENGEN